MKLAVLLNVFDGEEHLHDAIRPWRSKDHWIFAITQTVSNQGNFYDGGHNQVVKLHQQGWIDEFHFWQPDQLKNAAQNETMKRNLALEKAKKKGCTHFIFVDCDEIWLSDDIYDMKSDTDTAHRMFTYFANENLVLNPAENYYVPGICTLNKSTKVGAHNCGFLCDPTRTPNHKLSEGKAWMHHFSYVREDILRKIENSSARENIMKKKYMLLNDLKNAQDGYFCEFFSRELTDISNGIHKKGNDANRALGPQGTFHRKS